MPDQVVRSLREVGRNRFAERRSAIRIEDLTQFGAASGRHYEISKPARTRSALLEGMVLARQLPSGLGLHATEAVEKVDMSATVQLEPGVTISLLLDGVIDATLGGTPLHLSAESGPICHVWSLTRPTVLVRDTRCGRYVRKVNLNVPVPWLDAIRPSAESSAAAEFGRFVDRQLSVLSWIPSASAIRCAEEILGIGSSEGVLKTVVLEMNALGILHDVLARFDWAADAEDVANRLKPRDVSRARTAREVVLASLDSDVHLPQIAREAGMSVSTLQRVFRACYGVTVMEFVRVQRLERGRDALERGGVTVTEAAFIAGYSGAANFATAFLREFGYSPSQVR